MLWRTCFDEIKIIWKIEDWSTGNKVRNAVFCFFENVPNYFLRFQSHNIAPELSQTRLAKIWDSFILFLRWLGYKWLGVLNFFFYEFWEYFDHGKNEWVPRKLTCWMKKILLPSSRG